MENFTFYAPTLFAFGDGQERELGALVRRFGGTKALIVAGGSSARRSGALSDASAALEREGIPFRTLSGIEPNPRSGKVYEGIDLCRREGIDFLVAVGGGSVIDTAKAIGIGVPYGGDFWDFFRGTVKPERTLGVGVVLTIAAAGSEGSNSCVITQEEGTLKWGIPGTDVIRPRFAVLNPRYTCTLPSYQTACGATDMAAHILERYVTNTPDVDVTDRLCEALLQTIFAYGPVAVEHPEDLNARSQLMWAGMLAHNNSCGVGRAQDWASHQIGHELSALLDCAHGASLAVAMPAWMEYVLPHDPLRFAQLAVRVFGCGMDFAHPERTAREGVQRFREWLGRMGMPQSLSDLGVNEADIPTMVAHRREKKPVAFPFGGFVKIHEADMEAILRLADR